MFAFLKLKGRKNKKFLNTAPLTHETWCQYCWVTQVRPWHQHPEGTPRTSSSGNTQNSPAQRLPAAAGGGRILSIACFPQGAGRLQLSNIPISAGRQEIWFFGRSRILMAWNSSIYLGMIWIRVLLMCHSFRCVCSFKESGSSWNRMDPVDQN